MIKTMKTSKIIFTLIILFNFSNAFAASLLNPGTPTGSAVYNLNHNHNNSNSSDGLNKNAKNCFAYDYIQKCECLIYNYTGKFIIYHDDIEFAFGGNIDKIKYKLCRKVLNNFKDKFIILEK